MSCGSVLNGAEAGGAAAEPTKVTVAARTLPIAPLGPNNPWPHFRFQSEPSPVHTAADLSEEDRAGTFSDAAVPLLPYLVQDNYSRQRRSGSLPTIQMENAALRATFYPSLGGRMISLYDKRGRRELLFDNPVLQFANLAIRNAWFSGGVEWNGPLYGHSLLTCSPVFAGMVGPRGPLLRLYEFDRALETTWQVDVFLPLPRRPAVDPRQGHQPERPRRALLLVDEYRRAAGSRHARAGAGGLRPIARSVRAMRGWRFRSSTASTAACPLNYPSARSVFFRKPGNRKPWSVCLDGQGHGMSHVSTPTLFGRKFFTWGTGRGGKRWMEFLSETGKGDYIEIQGGVTPTQLQDRPLPADASIEWTECISPFAMDPNAAHDPDYAAACRGRGQSGRQRVPDAALKEMDALPDRAVPAPVRDTASSWGRLGLVIRKANRAQDQPGTDVRGQLGRRGAAMDRVALCRHVFAGDIEQTAVQFNVSAGWTDVLRESRTGTRRNVAARFAFGRRGTGKGRFWQGTRALPVVAGVEGQRAAQPLSGLAARARRRSRRCPAAYERAWSLCGDDRNLAVEIGEFLVRHKRYPAFDAFVKSLPAPIAAARADRVVEGAGRLEARRVCHGSPVAAAGVLHDPGRRAQPERSMVRLVHQGSRGPRRPQTDACREREAHAEFPPPAQIDFRTPDGWQRRRALWRLVQQGSPFKDTIPQWLEEDACPALRAPKKQRLSQC